MCEAVCGPVEMHDMVVCWGCFVGLAQARALGALEKVGHRNRRVYVYVEMLQPKYPSK